MVSRLPPFLLREHPSSSPDLGKFLGALCLSAAVLQDYATTYAQLFPTTQWGRLSTDFHHLLSSIGVEDQPTGFCFSCLLPRYPLSFREAPSSSATFLSNSFSGLLSGSWQEGRNGWGK